MMTPQKVTFYIYAEDEAQAVELQNSLNNFVRKKYNEGVLVTAGKLSKALEMFCNNFFVTNFLKQ